MVTLDEKIFGKNMDVFYTRYSIEKKKGELDVY